MTTEIDMKQVADEMHQNLEPIRDTRVAPSHGIAAIALSMAMKYHDINTVQDGALYQQYKIEGRNMRDLSLDIVFETAIRIELHLLASSDRIAQVLVDALEIKVEEGPPEEQAAEDEGGEQGRSAAEHAPPTSLPRKEEDRD